MADRILKTFIRELTLIAGPVPDLDKERVPWRAVCLVEDVCRTPTMIELKEIGAIPWLLIEFALFRIEVVRSPLRYSS